MCRGATVLSRDDHGDKVLRTPDDRIIKLFRRKRLFSSALLRPYVARFARASRLLQARGIRSLTVIDVFRIPSIKRHAVVYLLLPGQPLRETLEQQPQRIEALLARLAELLATLHERGIYFRAAHFGNVLVCPDEQLALIDISEARFFRAGLRPAMRARNFRPFLSYPGDVNALGKFGTDRFIGIYLNQARLNADNQRRFLATLERIHPMFRWSGAAPASLGASASSQ